MPTTQDFWTAFFSHPIIIAGGSVLAVALVNALVRQIGAGAKTQPRLKKLETDAKVLEPIPARLDAVETQQVSDRAFRRTTLTVIGHQNAALTTLLEVAQGKRVNGNVDRALSRMEDAQRETDEYLIESATNGR